MPDQYINNQMTTGKSEFSFLRLFWIGFIIYALCHALSSTSGIGLVIYPIIQMVGLVLMIAAIVRLIEFKIDNGYLRLVYILYCAWLISMIVKGYSYFSDYTYLRSFFLDPREGILYFSPIILLFPRNFVFYKKMFDTIITLGIFYVVFDILFLKDLLSSSDSATSQSIVETFSDLSFSCGFILLTYAYHSKKRQILSLVIVAMAILLAVVRARRGLILMYSSMVFIAYILYIFQSKMRLLVIYLTIFMGLLGAIYVSGLYRPHNNKFFGFLLERGNVDTRSTVELFFRDDMKPEDWIMGRGIKGEYFAPDVEEDQPTNYRGTIETGYEQTILKGGLISLGLFILIAIPAVIKGIFFSRNLLSKVAATWIFLSLMNSYPTTVNAFTLQYLLVWVSIGICYSKEIRYMKESTIKDILHTPIHINT